ncbi:MAG: FAD-dependent oxidoreductase [Dehalococcoidales bacterium]|nr:FAD-dependent oxidoreductase [Dehalococcoidales bacterium]
MMMKLLEPITIRGVQFKNRIVMPPMVVGLGVRGRRSRAYYLARAKGGVGTIIMGGVSVDLLATDDASGQPGSVDAFVDGLRPLVDDIHKTGAKIGVQLWHGNRFPAGMSMEDKRGEPVGVSATDKWRELTVPEIETIISRYAQAAVNCRRAGLDFAEVHGAHGYLICQFFSPVTNHRQDEYGGSLTRRMRFGTKCVAAIRAAVGDDYPIFYRLGAREDISGGITVDDAAKFAVKLEAAGVDVIDVSRGGSYGLKSTTGPEDEQNEGTLLPVAESIKRRVKVPVIAVGGFRTPKIVEEVLAQGRTDMVAIGRQLIADPYWAEKVATGRPEDITPCINCDMCHETALVGVNIRELSSAGGFGVRCSVNAAAGREAELTIEPASKPKKVMVVGGGPAGMEAARVAALRGHKVALYEKQNEIGGQLILAAVPPQKQRIAALNRYLAYQLKKSGVKVKLGVEVTPELVEKEKPDTLILATGSIPLKLKIPGMNRNNVVTATDILSGKVTVGEKVAVIGGELVGCEVADFLAHQGKKVSVLRRGAEMAANMVTSKRNSLLARLKDEKVNLVTGIKEYKAITEEGLVVINGEGKRQTFVADTIVIAAGAVSDARLAKTIQGKVDEIHLIGDCVEPRRIIEAIYEGARLGREI